MAAGEFLLLAHVEQGEFAALPEELFGFLGGAVLYVRHWQKLYDLQVVSATHSMAKGLCGDRDNIIMPLMNQAASGADTCPYRPHAAAVKRGSEGAPLLWRGLVIG